mgnify:CR=1 FL=1
MYQKKRYDISIEGNKAIKDLIVEKCMKNSFEYSTLELSLLEKYIIEIYNIGYKDYCYFRRLKKIVE